MEQAQSTNHTSTPRELFDALRQTLRQGVRRRYTVLWRVLMLAMDGQLRGLGQIFPDASSKMQYLIREHRLRADNDGRLLATAINGARHRIRHRGQQTDEELQRTFPYDLKAVCLFLARIMRPATVPADLARTFPEGWLDGGGRQRARDRKGQAIDCLRCTVDAFDLQHIHVTAAEDGRQLTVDYAHTSQHNPGDWSYLHGLLAVGMQLNLIRPREQDHVLYPELIIIHPDSLISVTSVAGCFHPCGTSPYWEAIRRIKPQELTIPILLGNLAGQFLDEAAYGAQTTYAESVGQFFHRNALSLSTCEGIDAGFHTEAQRQRDNIRQTMSASVHLGNDRGLNAGEMILEPSFFCETLGLQGRMDFIHLNMDTIVEQKSGKGAFGSTDLRPLPQQAHYVQLLLYRAIFHYAYRRLPYDAISSSLFYSKYTKGLLELGSAPTLLFEAIRMRNQLAWLDTYCASQGYGFLRRLTSEMVCPKASGKLWTQYVRPQLEQTLAPLRTASPLAVAYVLRFLHFVAREQMLAKVGSYTKEDSGFATLWNCSTEEKRQAGCIYERLEMDGMDECASQEDISFSFTTEVDADTTNFRLGDIVVFYPYRPDSEPQATRAIVFRSTITAIRPDGITVHLRNPQHTSVFAHYEGCLWAVEHDFMEASHNAQSRGIFSLLSATPKRQALILGQRTPAIDTTVARLGDYAQKPQSPGSTGQTDGNARSDEFNQLVGHAMQAQDIYLIIGPPGTGKTSFGMLNVLREQLLRPGTSVLLMAYTNRAVDEMCSKLIGEGIDFIRLGSEFSCSPECRDHLLDRRTAQYNRVDDLRELLLSTRVFCGTTTSFNSHSQLFALKRFDLAIIDEASQLLEPDLIGLLAARHGEADAIARFVLIGDEKQLPAVVQQEPALSHVDEPELRAIGLTDCRLSLFERLLRLYGNMGEAFCHTLTHQGRMHPAIARFPSEAFYGGALQPVPLRHQQEPSAYRRITFISYDAFDPTDETDKVNKAEARIIADVVRRATAAMGNDPSVGIIVPYRNQISTVRGFLERGERKEERGKRKEEGGKRKEERGRRKEERGEGRGEREMSCGSVCSHEVSADKAVLSPLSPLPSPLSPVTIDTVERFQGSERDLIVYGFTAKHPYQLDFLSANDYVTDDGTIIDRKLNVAMTRARRRLVLVGNAPLLVRDPVFARLIDYCKQQGCYYERAAEE